jgi:hypothetical protein
MTFSRTPFRDFIQTPNGIGANGLGAFSLVIRPTYGPFSAPVSGSNAVEVELNWQRLLITSVVYSPDSFSMWLAERVN